MNNKVMSLFEKLIDSEIERVKKLPKMTFDKGSF